MIYIQEGVKGVALIFSLCIIYMALSVFFGQIMLDKLSGLSLETLKSCLNYDPETGLFTWKVKLSNRVIVGDIAGAIDGYGYVQIKLFGVPYKAHRLAWFYMTGWWPKEQIDHENRVRHDNRWKNIREASQTQNSQNQSASFSKIHELKGAYESQGTWFSTINVFGKQIYLGRFKSPEEAHTAYVEAAKLHFKEFATDGKQSIVRQLYCGDKMVKYLVYIASLRGPEAQVWHEKDMTRDGKPIQTLYKRELTINDDGVSLQGLMERYPFEAKE